ncbi:MAG: hypothetical protein IME98_00485, partial [Proteobacteria bacterium]|nr:hypothetical protein [Pseudomonadota bacterium]
MLEKLLIKLPKPLAIGGGSLFIVIIGILYSRVWGMAALLTISALLLSIAIFSPLLVMLMALFSIPFDRMAAFMGSFTVAKVMIAVTIAALVFRML